MQHQALKGVLPGRLAQAEEKVTRTQNYPLITITFGVLLSSGLSSIMICKVYGSLSHSFFNFFFFLFFFFFFSLTLLSCWHFCPLRAHYPCHLFHLHLSFNFFQYSSSFPPLSLNLLIIHTFTLPRSHFPIGAEYSISVRERCKKNKEKKPNKC